MYELTVLLTGLILIAYAFYKYATLNNDYFEKRGVPYIKPSFLIGNSGAFFRKDASYYKIINNFYKTFPTKKIMGVFDFRKPYYIIRDPEIVKKMAIKDFDYFEDHRVIIDENMDSLFGNSLIMLCGEKWRDMRATLSPAFTGSKMRQMFHLVAECANEMTKHFIEKANNGEEIKCEMKELFSKYTNDVIATAAFGIKVNSFQDTENEFFKTGQAFINFNKIKTIIKFGLLNLVPSLMKILNIEFVDSNISKFFRSMVLDTMAIREREGIFRPDMINILMQVKKGSTDLFQTHVEDSKMDGFATVEESTIGKMNVKRQWNDNEIAAQCFLFFLAGFDTSSTLLSFMAYELALNLDVQQKLYVEILETSQSLNGNQLDYDNLQNMNYMDMVISEALRKWPPAPFSDRLCVKDYLYDDGEVQFIIEKGVFIWFPTYAFHWDPEYFPNPAKFDPERFNAINKYNIIPGTYMPFGVGPRNCIGSRFALMELKAILYYMILHFSLKPYEETQIPLKLGIGRFGVKTEKGIYLEFKFRE